MSLSSTTRATTPHVRIISHYKGQQIPVESNILVSGISSRAPAADETHTNCTVSVLLNDIKPYQNAPATGQRGTNDFSSWQNNITPK